MITGIPENEATFVIIPTIVDSKEKVKEMFRNLEKDYLANKSQNLYFCLLGDCKQSDKEIEEYDVDVLRRGIEETERLNKKYPSFNFPIFQIFQVGFFLNYQKFYILKANLTFYF